jgi:hypothetical protein
VQNENGTWAENEALRSQKQPGRWRSRYPIRSGIGLRARTLSGHLYQEQWDKLLAQTDELKKFINENRDLLKKKV